MSDDIEVSVTTCLFCSALGPFMTVEHIIPESLGNDELVLQQEVCDSCQAYFGKEVEQFALAKTPIAFWRTYLSIRTKKGRLPSVDLSNPSQAKGTLQAVHARHDNRVGFTAHDDGSVSVDVDDPELVRQILSGQRESLTFVFTPKVLHMLGRFLLKIGVELLAGADGSQARSPQYNDAREHARFGTGDRLWPLFHFSSGNLSELRRFEQDEDGLLEHVQCYEYEVVTAHESTLLRFSMGTDNWVISLSHRYPDPRIGSAFQGHKLNLIWYPDVA